MNDEKQHDTEEEETQLDCQYDLQKECCRNCKDRRCKGAEEEDEE